MAKTKRKNKKNQQRPKEEIAEDYCFVCKDGGKLLICEYKQCLKSYHFECLEKDSSFSTSKEKWVCDWHSCMICHRTSQVQCYCCPKATCWHCIDVAELVNIKGKYGFCSSCLKLALLVEDNKDTDSDGEKVDFKDRETYEGLFMEYYKIIQKEEGFSVDKLHAAQKGLKTGKNILSGSDTEESGDVEEEEMSSEEDVDSMRGYRLQHKNKRLKKGLPVMQMQCVKSKRMQFCGWGSTSLIQFLESIGKDTSEKLTQHDVYFIIRRYITEHNLVDPTKKKSIVCDESLRSIFQRRTVNKNKIFGLLEVHFLENLSESEDEEEAMNHSEYKEESALVTCKTRKRSKADKESLKRDAIHSVPHSCYASVTAENIKHVYLRKSLVYELSKQPESFENKVKGSFVRVKNNPHDYYQKNSHQLVQVTGIMKSVTGENDEEIILCVSKIPKEISLSLLSDADFSEEECEDLCQRVKSGLVQKPTVVELQEKARCLHVDITKHWIARELKLLDLRKDQANEKGWRREFHEYIERKKLLETPLEQARLLENYPIVIPDVADPEPESQNQDTADEQKLDEVLPHSIFPKSQNHKPEDVAFLEATIRDTADEQKREEAFLESVSRMDSDNKSGSNGVSDAAFHEATIRDTADEQKGEEAFPESTSPMYPNKKSGSNGISVDEEYHAPLILEAKQNLDRIAMPVSPHNSTPMDKRSEAELSILQEHSLQVHLTLNDQPEMTSQIYAGFQQATTKKQEPAGDQVIELSSDDESEQDAAVGRRTLEDPESSVWLISGPDGIARKRKYSLSLLKRWSDASSYALKFKVWKEDQSQEQAIPLKDAINLAFPGL